MNADVEASSSDSDDSVSCYYKLTSRVPANKASKFQGEKKKMKMKMKRHHLSSDSGQSSGDDESDSDDDKPLAHLSHVKKTVTVKGKKEKKRRRYVSSDSDESYNSDNTESSAINDFDTWRKQRRKKKEKKQQKHKKQKRPSSPSLNGVIYCATRDWLESTKNKGHEKDIVPVYSATITPPAYAPAASSAAVDPERERLSMFVVVKDKMAEGMLVPSRLLPNRKVLERELEFVGCKGSTLFHRGKAVFPKDVTPEMRKDKHFGTILEGCIYPLSIKKFSFNAVNSLEKSLSVDFFAIVDCDNF